jgi:hypothetical protein
MRVSLALLVGDLVVLGVSFFWKVRTELEPEHVHYALFYLNELGPRKVQGEYKSIGDEEMRKRRRKMSGSLLYYVSKIPLVVTIILFD